MLIKAPPSYEERLRTLIESMEHIDLDYTPYMVQIHQSDTLGNLIKLEDFCEYAKRNSIDDAGYALASVCSQNGISYNNVGFLVEETSLYDNYELLTLGSFLSEHGYKTYIQPISEKSPYYVELERCLALDEAYDYKDSINLKAYCEGSNKPKRFAAIRHKSRKLKSKLSKTGLNEEKAYLIRQLDKTLKSETDMGEVLNLI